MKIGLFFGSFNPIHNGHLAIANYMREFGGIDQLWFVVSPHNPLKPKTGLLPEYQRLHLVNLAIGDQPGYKASRIEFDMPRPSYTIDTLAFLEEKHPGVHFCLILGADGLPTFHKWKNYQVILDRYDLLVYPRPGYEPGSELNPVIRNWERIHFTKAPLVEISSTFIRQAIRQGHRVDFFMPQAVAAYVDEMHFYKK